MAAAPLIDALIVANDRLIIKTRGSGLYEITDRVTDFVTQRGHGAADSMLTIFVPHTSCSVVIQENADRDVRRDLDDFFARPVPAGDDPSMRWLRHTAEGPDDMPAHIKAALLPTSIGVPVINGDLALGTWQGIYLFEHRAMAHERRIILHLGP